MRGRLQIGDTVWINDEYIESKEDKNLLFFVVDIAPTEDGICVFLNGKEKPFKIWALTKIVLKKYED